MNHTDHAGFDITVREEQSPDEVLEGDAKVLEMVGIEEGIADRVDVREDDAEFHEKFVHLALRAEGHDAVYRIEWEPAYDEEENDTGKILRGLDLSFARRAKTTQHRPRGLMMVSAAAETEDTETANGTATTWLAGIHRDDLL